MTAAGRYVGMLITVLLWTSPALSQVVIVERNVNLRPDPSSQHEALRKLEPPEVAALLDTVKTGNYYNVRTSEGLEGWVWASNVDVDLDQGFDVDPPPAPSSSPYDRDDWEHWSDADGDCQDTRQEVLIRDSTVPVVFEDSSQCRVESGRWVGVYSDQVFTDPSDVDIDHMVPLKNAHDSGGWRWDADKKEDYANNMEDEQHLLAVDDGLNQSKGSRGPEEWMPPDSSFHCEYVEIWRRIKAEWKMTMTTAEKAFTDSVTVACGT